MVKQKLRVSDMFKEALTLICRKNNFVVLTSFSSLPLFCFLVYYELLLQTTLVQISEYVRKNPGYLDYKWQTLLHTAIRVTGVCSNNLVQLGVLYLVPFHLLELCTAFVTVSLAAETPLSKANFRGTLATSIWVLLLSTCTLVGSIWLASIYYVLLRNSGYYNLYFGVFYRGVCLALLAKYLEWSAIWNMSIVISILADLHGANALKLSAYLSRGNERQGLLIALVFSVWGLGLRCSCLFFQCRERRTGIFAQIGLFCMVNVMKWVVYKVYFCNCKRRVSKKKGDEEMGKVVG